MGKLVFGLVLLLLGVFMRVGAATIRVDGARPVSGALRVFGLASLTLGVIIMLASTIVVIGPGSVGVRHAFGYVDPQALMSGIRVVTPWSSVERFSIREEQFPTIDQPENIDALSREQMGMKIDVALRWQIDPLEAPKIFREIGAEDQIRSVVRNAIRNGVRDGMVQFSINDIAQQPDCVGHGERGGFGSGDPAAGRRTTLPDRNRDGVLPARPAAAAASRTGDQQQDRAAAADRD
jgi:SPFH domain/Band 7 family protein